jgi:long-chain acyl-CoA synthetase
MLSIIDKLPSIKSIIVMDAIDNEMIAIGNKANVEVVLMSEVERQGAEHPLQPNPPQTDSLATICYTSGTTGTPKGVMLTHGNFLAFCACTNALASKDRIYKFGPDDVHISYLPLAHVFERIIHLVFTYNGGSIGFFLGDTLKLMDDIQVLKPTLFASVPRLYNRIYDRVLSGVNEKGGLSKYLFDMALASKKNGLKHGTVKHCIWDALVFSKVRARLGGRIKIMITGAAPISSEVTDFMRCAFSCEFIEGYGQTETVAALCVTDKYDLDSGHNGSPMPCCEIKLIDVPGMGYTSKDKPYPRGEICLRGSCVFKGYYKEPEKTKEALDKDGWCRTGDVGLWDEKGRMKIIDRVKKYSYSPTNYSIFKLAQGEYIAPEKIENVYTRHELVAQIFVYGDSLQSHLVAIIIPDADTFKPWAKKICPDKSYEEQCKDSTINKELLKSLTAFARTTELKGFEVVKSIYLDHQLFSVENGLFTPTFKLKRHEAKIKYQDAINAMYQQS